LRFVDSGNVNSDNLVGNVGFNYVLTAADSIGVFYRFSSYHYSGNPEAIGDHTVNFAYGAKSVGALPCKLSGGPEITTFRVPIGTQTHRSDRPFPRGIAYVNAANQSLRLRESGCRSERETS